MRFIAIFLFLFSTYLGAIENNFYYNGNKKVSLEKINTTQSTSRSVDSADIIYYKTSRNITLGVTNEIIIKVKDSTMLQYLEKKYNFSIIKEIFTGTYLIKITNPEDTITIANALHQENSIEYASPNFVKSINKR